MNPTAARHAVMFLEEAQVGCMTDARTRNQLFLSAFALLLTITLGSVVALAQQQVAKRDAAFTTRLTGEFVDIRAGSFRMGDVAGKGTPAELPVHTVKIKAFRIGKTEVTRGQFARFVQETDYKTDAERDAGGNQGCKILDLIEHKTMYRPGKNWRDPLYTQTDDHPVVCVSWNDAQAFIAWLNSKTGRHFRLLSEAEWEYAARAGSEDVFPWGSDPNQACTYGNVSDSTTLPNGKPQLAAGQTKTLDCKDGYFRPAPVASFKPNAFGVYDMIGNVWEWTQDCWNDTYSGAPADGSAWETGDCSQRIFLGGSYDNNATQLRVSVRFKSDPTLRDIALGFRLAEDR